MTMNDIPHDAHTKPTAPSMDAVEPTFRQKLLSLYERFAYVKKTGKNAHFKYSFMQESVMKAKFNLACRELGLVVVQTEVEPVGVSTGKECVVKLRLHIEDVRGPVHGGVVLEGIGGGTDSSDKAPMKAIVSAYKYALACGLHVETGDDPEADASTDASVAADLLARITAATDRNALEFLKPELAGQKGSAGFDALKAAFKTRKEALTADA